MSIVIRGLQQGLVSKGLGGVNLGPDEEIVELQLTAISILEKDTYPTTGTYNNVEGWKWSKSKPQNLALERERINTHIGGYEYSLEEGTIYSDWKGAALNGLEVSIKETQSKTKRSKWSAEVNNGEYSILNKTNFLYGNYSSSLILNDNLFYSLDEKSKKNFKICTYKRDSFFNNIPNIEYEFDENLNKEYSYIINENEDLILNQLYTKQIGVGDNPEEGNWEFCGIGNNNRNVIFTEHFPITNVRVIEKTVNGNYLNWTETNKFNNLNQSEFIVDKHSGKIYFNNNEDIYLYVKKDHGNKISFYKEIDMLKESGLINNSIEYFSKSKFEIYLDPERQSQFDVGDKIKINKQGKNFSNNSEIFISYTVYPRLNYEIKEEKRTSNIDLKPHERGLSIGLIEISPYENTLSKINLSCDKNLISKDLYKTLFIGNDSTIIKAETLNYNNKPIKEIKVNFFADKGIFEGSSQEQGEITSDEGVCFTNYSEPYSNESLSEYVDVSYEGNDSVIEISSITPGATVDDFSIFQVLKTDPYFGSLGFKAEVESYEFKDNKYYIKLKNKLLDAEEYITYQNYDFSDNAIVFDYLCQKNFINYGLGYFYFNNNTISSRGLIENIIEDQYLIVDPLNFNNIFFEEITSVRLYKRNELVFNLDQIKNTGKSFDRICYYSDGAEYKVLKPTRINGRKLIFENIQIPQANATSISNLIGAYKVFSPKINKVWAEATDPATGRIIRSNTLKIVTDFPSYLKGVEGFRFKQDLDESEAGLGGSNFISINPAIQNQINFMI